MSEHALTVLQSCSLLSGLPAAALREAAAVARVRPFQANQVIYERGEVQSTLSVVGSGSVRISSTNEQGREVLLTLFEAGAWFGDTVFSPGMPRVFGATAHTDGDLVEVPGQDYRELLARFPEAYPRTLDMLSRRLWSAISIIEDNVLRDIPARVGRRLLFLAEMHDHSRGLGPVTFKLTREHIANMMGMTRQGVHGVLKTMEEEGLIHFGYGVITLPDPNALRDYLNRRPD
ncbi:Crp/Fnr family transcriptional regulator [Alloalcanivorax mobilis]|uniref:Crp/Fnr family transcriptional regulator n=1 Tax=Alloalcanivorax mobilis TaxID=2019569 RepID=UPI000C7785A5|nr:Crp/Fnr family transcriptional regulator [Alloalcanivorax mobilis]